MSNLQNNFTTPEQSKRLLELGMPADSADMHYHQECVRIKYDKGEFEYFLRYGKPDANEYSTDIPCWSVGRLIEIYIIARGLDTAYLPIEKGEDMGKYLIRLYEEKARDLDFSKLED